MPRDYAKYKPKPIKQKRGTEGWQKRLLLLIVLLAIIFALILSVYLYKNKSSDAIKPPFTSWMSQLHSRFTHKKLEMSSTAVSNVKQINQEPEVRFNFYTELPNMQVTLPETEEAPVTPKHAPLAVIAQTTETSAVTKPANEPIKPENKKLYIVQLGLFKNETAAGQTRVSLLLAGCEADTVTVTDEATKTTLYRLQKGPYPTLSQANGVVKQLQKKGVSAVVKPL